MARITVHTASFNRAHTLVRLYESLCAQTCKDFDWIVSDDGSTDNTEDLVREWLTKDNGFDIIYRKLPHIGFPRALNDGVEHANTEWFMMVDSDDWLMPETVEKIRPWLEEIKDKDHYAGIGITRCHPDGSYMKDQVPIIDPEVGYVDATNIERAAYNLNMDCFEVSRTAILRKYPFQYWPTEEYAPPALNYNTMALDGWKYRWRSDMLYICEYLSDGLTKSNKKVKNNPMGYAMMYNQQLLWQKGFKASFNNALQMIAMCGYARNWGYLKQSNNKWMTAVVFLPGVLWAIRRKKQFNHSV